jgi:hypothetical protein
MTAFENWMNIKVDPQWKKTGWSYSVPAPTVFDEAMKIVHNGQPLTGEALKEVARPEGSPIHAIANWNEHENSEAYLNHHFASVIGALRMVVVTEEVCEEPKKEIPIFVNVIHEGVRQYMPTQTVARDKNLMRQAIEKALTDFERLNNRYEMLTELGGLRSSVDREIKVIKAGLTTQDPAPMQ